MAVAIRKINPSLTGASAPEESAWPLSSGVALARKPGMPVHIEAKFIRLRPAQGRADLQLAGGTFVSVPIGCVVELRDGNGKAGGPSDHGNS